MEHENPRRRQTRGAAKMTGDEIGGHGMKRLASAVEQCEIEEGEIDGRQNVRLAATELLSSRKQTLADVV